MVLLAVAAVAGTAGCTDLDQASAAGAGDGDLVSETADRVAAADGQSWTATYRLAGGEAARVARSQKPSRIAFTFPSGVMIITPEAATRCTRTAGRTTCTDADRRDGEEGPPATTGLIAPAAILDMLESAAIDPDMAVTPRETTIAGRHASCLKLGGVDQSAAPDFEVCVTVEGTVAAFAGTVAGAPVEMTLTDYRAEVDESDFTVPPNAHLDRGDLRTAPHPTSPHSAAPTPSR
ncbi:hypothetical protein AB0G04_29750 [Actinoplanes sp. NPDC023801]|uniref:hypothetical protein n=1 Tax=Actinoplanes sp. NPDC023801 TaxID=3154595 RepID=UPI0033FB95D0